jgi:hypothetical protein
MCVFSNAVDQWRPCVYPQPANPPPFVPVPSWPYVPPITPKVDSETAELMKKALEILDRIDKKLGLRDCTNEAPQKAEFMKQLESLAQP